MVTTEAKMSEVLSLFPTGKTLPSLRCDACGASAEASCECGVGYSPVKVIAARAVAANPEKSDRALAEETGVPHATISRARKRSTVSFETVDLPKRIGRDGNARRMPKRGKAKAKAKAKVVQIADAAAINQFSREFERFCDGFQKRVLAWLDDHPNLELSLLYSLSNNINAMSAGLVFAIDDREPKKEEKHG
jgi:hypothetical protein